MTSRNKWGSGLHNFCEIPVQLSTETHLFFRLKPKSKGSTSCALILSTARQTSTAWYRSDPYLEYLSKDLKLQTSQIYSSFLLMLNIKTKYSYIKAFKNIIKPQEEFLFYRKSEGKPSLTAEDTLQPGHKMVAAGYALYGSATMMVLSTGGAVNGFTLDPVRYQYERKRHRN